ncbi:RlpA-like double-psi beta-barrel-protein domain-containing protein-containing protein [Annulohypoxylon maeteangense]|uniref:RlpA-like double-psi beta-barrel-protein domain-containing protein-containing protein n=1 Tax=Annulohypoxylon maeteangense TaxID=1927788 RepID=UPI0020081BC7|nr:RlpA-like double-psi beta-barrel-protein domain-containing protein-containing protein [Annulohypoxylon maeteangense]KAI0888601.1 RlpA-like double-psi beta-barrel-protein domain-containing protein-containing protein [Annulohypoxylon maeteangense]
MYSITKTIITLGALVAPSLAFSGEMTWYQPGLGACGQTNTASDAVVAMSSPDQDGHCGQTVSISYGGKTVTATVVDKCPGCSATSIDASPAVFQQLASLDAGRVQITWEYA